MDKEDTTQNSVDVGGKASGVNLHSESDSVILSVTSVGIQLYNLLRKGERYVSSVNLHS